MNQKWKGFQKILSISFFFFFLTFLFLGCSRQDMDLVKEKVNEKQEEIASNVEKEIKETILNQIKDFFQNTDFMEAFGMDDTEKSDMEEKLNNMIENYHFDVSNMKDVEKQLDTLFDPDTIAEQENQDNQKIKSIIDEIKQQILEGLG